jgi:hypothetical protein
MAVYCITYDLDERGKRNYAGLIARIKEFPDHCHALQSVWVVATSWTPQQVLEHLKPALDLRLHMHIADKVMIVTVMQGSPWLLSWDFPAIDDESSISGTVASWLRHWIAA